MSQFSVEEKELLRNKNVIEETSNAIDVDDWKYEFLEIGLTIPLENIDKNIDNILIRKRESELGGDGYLYSCEQFLFRGNLMYERLFIEENGGDWYESEDFTGKDHTDKLEKELRKHVVDFYMENY